MKSILISAAAAAMVLGNVSASHAFLDAFLDREPTPEERAAIEGVLLAQGFTAWDEIEFDNDGSGAPRSEIRALALAGA